MENLSPMLGEGKEKGIKTDWQPVLRPSLVDKINLRESEIEKIELELESERHRVQEKIDDRRRFFLKLAAGTGLGLFAVTFLPKKASALVMGGTPSTSVVGLKNEANVQINPATEETLQSLADSAGGHVIERYTKLLTSSGSIKTPATGKRLRIYNTKFSLSADLTSVAFRFTSGGADYEKYLAPKTGGLYGANTHPNFIEGEIDEDIYCHIVGSGNVQIYIDYSEI